MKRQRQYPQLYGRRVLGWCAVIGMAVGLAAMLMGCASGQPVGAPVDPLVLPANIVQPTPHPTALTYSAWRAQTPISIATEDEVFVALVEAGIPHRDASVLARASVNCESPVRDKDGRSIGALLTATGDGGASRGPLQVHVGYNPWASGMALQDLPTAARAAAIIYHDGGTARWSCAR